MLARRTNGKVPCNDDKRRSPRLTDFASANAPMRAALALATKIAAGDTTLLLLGETGVGKEWMARSIHEAGRRAVGPFVAINCAALNESLIESELFGHEEGAFTGAVRIHRGCFEIAEGGTVFLDEIAELPLQLQAKLLRVLQEREVRRVGAERSLVVDVRVMSASNCDLLAEVHAGRFRKDLYYRLSVVSLTIPPLRQRREDVPMLVERFLQSFAGPCSRSVRFDAEALAAMIRYDWPGNIRELMNAVERAVLLAPGDVITADLLPEAVVGTALSLSRRQTYADGAAVANAPLADSLRVVRRQAIDAAERAYLTGLLRQTGGKVGETARRAGVTARALSARMRRFGLRKEEFRKAQPGNATE